ncbi:MULTISPECIES: Rrf2 family transcriptional regulator [Ruminococcus]|uniref:Transcriptional regulator, BadM/Rrf2 family n=1 Tax=Ruminococcus flavefaciens TaxID=1265 RepID=A0A1M7JM26_RUMFL|nr:MULTISPECIES: Rrf2 family transcriptional regulator [Ruminococcus]MCR4795789.1 Rrf2 family transcriptional regulator [Ruminococcus sp.]SHM54169.1 transcriptional regulator, BadM/Rrf2 family [Ruminococcus flavefaciens]
MKVSTKVECGIIALIDIAVNSRCGKVVKVNAIAERNNISAKYLEQIIPLLKQASIISSIKGASGGYILTRKPSDITLNEIVNALDKTIFSLTTFSDDLLSDANTAINNCLWEPITDYMCSFSEKITLETLADRYNELNSIKSEPMYYI